MRFSVISEIPGRTRLQLAGPVPEGDLDALMKLSTDIKGVTKFRVYGRIGQMAIEFDAPRRADGRQAYRVGGLLLGRHRLREPGHATRHRHLVREARRHVCGGAPWFGGAFWRGQFWFDGVLWFGGVDGMPWRDGASWREPLTLSRDQMRAEALLRLELEQGESGFLGERA